MLPILNQSRQLYQRILSGRKPTESEIDDKIQAGRDMVNMTRHPGWKRLEAFLKTQEDGIAETMKRGVRPNLLFGKDRLRVYDELQTELKAILKIFTFIKLTIENGERYSRRRAKTDRE